MQCPECEADQRDDSLFCTKCGTKLVGEPQRPPEETEAVEEPLISTSAKDEEEKILRELKEALKVVEEPNQPPADKHVPFFRSWKVWVAGGVLVVAGLVAVAMQMVLRHQPPPPPPELAPVEQAAPFTPSPSTAEEDAERTTAGKISAILEAIHKYQSMKKVLPPSLSSINKGYTELDGLKDGWGQNLLYLVDLTNNSFVVHSLGPDGIRGTPDDILVTNENQEAWISKNEQKAAEWRLASPNLYAQLTAVGPDAEELKKLQAARKAESLEKKKDEALLDEKRKQQAEVQRAEALRQEETRKKQAEAKSREEEQQQSRLREEAARQLQAQRQAKSLREDFQSGLAQWDAPATWEVIREKEFAVLRIQGLGFLKMDPTWDNYRAEFDVRVNKESAGWVVRAQNSSNFYLFKLGSDKAKAIPKNSLVKYIFSDGKYLNSLKREDAPGATGVVLLPFKVRNKDYYRVSVSLKGFSISHAINGIQVDDWSDTTFDRGRFGFNASIIETATVRSVSLEPLK
jgi:hypothetical protein